MAIQFTQDSGRAGNMVMSRLFLEGWETLESLKWCPCGYYYTTLFFPGNAKAHQVTEPSEITHTDARTPRQSRS